MIAVIETGSKQYLVSEGQRVEVELLTAEKSVEFKPLLIIDGDTTLIGKPVIDSATVVANIVEADKKDQKVSVQHYKAKKRQRSIHGHRQHKTVLEIASIKK